MTKDDKTKEGGLSDSKRSPEHNVKGKIKKNKKKKKHINRNPSNVSSSSASEVESETADDQTKEKFFDAHESYHGPAPHGLEGPQAPAIGATIPPIALTQPVNNPKLQVTPPRQEHEVDERKKRPL